MYATPVPDIAIQKPSHKTIPSFLRPESHVTTSESCFLSNRETLHLVTKRLDLPGELGGLVGGDAGGDDGAAHAAGAAEHRLAGDVDVRDALVLAEEGKVQQNGEGSRISREDGNLAGSTVEGLGDCEEEGCQSRCSGRRTGREREGRGGAATYPRWHPSWLDEVGWRTGRGRGSPATWQRRLEARLCASRLVSCSMLGSVPVDGPSQVRVGRPVANLPADSSAILILREKKERDKARLWKVHCRWGGRERGELGGEQDLLCEQVD